MTHQRFHHFTHLRRGHERSFHIDLSKFRLTVSTQVFVTEAFNDLIVTVKTGHHQQLFEVKDGVLFTPPFTSSALPGITRDAIIKLAKELGIEVREQVLSRESLYLADEVFMSGTAAEITPVRSVDGIQVGEGRCGPVTKRIQQAFFGLFTGETEDKWGWLDQVNQ